MDSVGDVVNTIQGFFVPQQQKPVIPQLVRRIPQVFRSGGNAYSTEDNYNNDYSSAGTDLFNPIRELINRRAPIPVTSSTEKPLIDQYVGGPYDRQYIPEASDVRPVKDDSKGQQLDQTLRSLFTGLIGNTRVGDDKERTSKSANGKQDNVESEPSLLGAIGSFLDSGFNTAKRNKTSGNDFFGNIFGNINGTDGRDIVKGFADAIN